MTTNVKPGRKHFLGKVRKRIVGPYPVALHTKDGFDLSQLITAKLSPVERYVVQSSLHSEDGLFHYSYEDWRIKRINKILQLYDLNELQGKRILELGCGHGEIGAFFADAGAEVLGLEGRLQNANFARLKQRGVQRFRCEHFDLDSDFSSFGRFDLIIDFGLIYHLKNVDAHLKHCFAMADDILLETVICDSPDPHKIVFLDENRSRDDEALDGIGSRVTSAYVERLAEENGFDFERFDTPDLNAGDESNQQFLYDWTPRNDDELGDSFTLRRFWRLRKKPGG